MNEEEKKMDINKTLKVVQEDYLYGARNLILRNYPDMGSSKLNTVLKAIERLSDQIDKLQFS